MRLSKTLARIRANQPVRMCSLGTFNPAYIRHAAHFGFDCIWLDAEHRCFTEKDIQSLMPYFHLYDIDCMLRAPTLEKTRLYRYFEDGATGLMIPHVSTPEKAKMLVDSVKFPPIGDRGLDGAGFDSDFIIQGGEDYPQQANAQTFLVVQIETIEAVANADAIAAIDGIDGLFIGPGDLGLRLKASPTDLTLEDAFAQVAAAAKTHGKAWGCPALSAEHLTQLHGQGAQILAHGGDFRAMMLMLEQWGLDFENAFGKGV
ncbi:MAG: HpcH/HpaI aldolase/citrate lyase family protein [Maioricimonas sp. JB049]